MERTDSGGKAERDGKAGRDGIARGDGRGVGDGRGGDGEGCRGQRKGSNRADEPCGNGRPNGIEERSAAMAWTRIAEGEDAYAVTLVREMGYARALEWVADGDAEAGDVGVAGSGLAKAKARWKTRLAALGPDVVESDGSMGFVMPGDPLWPAALDDLGDTRPLGLWFRGDGKVLARAGAAVVGSRDSSPYGVKIATDVAYELADSGVNVVSGGAFGIDVAAHRGALAADGYTVAVSACGVDRYYPASHADLYLEILRRGGAVCSEAPPGAAPHKHRFLSRNRIIAALSRAVVVVEAPFRSGALSTAHHAMTIGRPVGAFPGPVTSPRSSGCHRLLREGAACVTQTGEVLELMGMDAGRGAEARPGGRPGPRGGKQSGLKQSGPDRQSGVGRSPFGEQPGLGEPPDLGGMQTERQLALDVLDPLASRVCEALPVSRGAPVEKIAAVAGVSVTEALTGLGRLERQGIAARNAGLWKLARKGR